MHTTHRPNTPSTDGGPRQSAAKTKFRRRRRMRIFIRPLLFVLTAVFVLTACGGSTAAPATDNSPADGKIMVGGLNKQIYIPNKLAELLGYFKEQNLNVTLIDEGSGQASEEQVIAGNLDGGSGS